MYEAHSSPGHIEATQPESVGYQFRYQDVAQTRNPKQSTSEYHVDV